MDALLVCAHIAVGTTDKSNVLHQTKLGPWSISLACTVCYEHLNLGCNCERMQSMQSCIARLLPYTVGCKFQALVGQDDQ